MSWHGRCGVMQKGGRSMRRAPCQTSMTFCAVQCSSCLNGGFTGPCVRTFCSLLCMFARCRG